MPWIEINDTVLRYRKDGIGRSTLLLVHEMGGTLESWDFVVERLQDDFTILRFDMRGCGLSEWKPGGLAIADLSGDIAALLDALGIDKPCTVIGCAVGAAVGIHFAAHYANRTAALVAMAPSVGLPPERRAGAHARAAQLESEGSRPTIDEQLAKTYPTALRRDTERFEEIRRRRLTANPFAAAALGRMLADIDLTEELARVVCPTLILAGRHDAVRGPEGVAETARLIRGAEISVLETGHFMPLQTPDLVATAITKFLAVKELPGAAHGVSAGASA
jgi:3-oxoadipate enol-lactonase